MKNIIADIARGKWLVNPVLVPEFEKLANQFLSREYKGVEIDRKKFMAAVNDSSIPMNQSTQQISRVVILPITGLIPTYGEMCMLGSDDYLTMLRELNNDDSVSAIVIKGDGPGSTVDAMNAFMEFALEKKKPIIGLFNECNSGYYWLANLICDYIMANFDVSSEFGSIGVLSMLLDGRKAMENDGYKALIIRAPQSKMKAQATIDFYEGKDEEFISAIEAEMEPVAQKFIDAVKFKRPQVKDVEGIFEGATFNAQKSLRLGLIDSIGNEKLAVEKAIQFATLNNL